MEWVNEGEHQQIEIESDFLALMAQEISEFEEWQFRLQEDLDQMMDQPATDENIQKLGAVVDYYFSDMLFQHDDHEVHVIRTDDGGIAITVFMEYADPADYCLDFGVNHGVDFEVHLRSQPTEDDLRRVMDDMKLTHAEELENQAHVKLIRTIQERVERQAALEAHAEMEAWHHAVMAERAHMAAAADIAVTSSSPGDLQPESPDDILFAPIVTDEKKEVPSAGSNDEFFYVDCAG